MNDKELGRLRESEPVLRRAGRCPVVLEPGYNSCGTDVSFLSRRDDKGRFGQNAQVRRYAAPLSTLVP